MSLNLNEIRRRLRLAAPNAGDNSYYSNAQLDAALDRLFSRFLRVTSCVELNDVLDFAASENEVDFTDLPGFLPGRMLRSRLVSSDDYPTVRTDFSVVDAGGLLDKLSRAGDATGTPCQLAFLDTVTAKLFPAPSADGQVRVHYAPLQTPWTIGTRGTYSSSADYLPDDIVDSGGTLYRAKLTNTNVAVATTTTWENLGTGTLVGPSDIVSVIPDGLLGELIATGGPLFLQYRDPENQKAIGADWAVYAAFELECTSIGSTLGRSIDREPTPYFGGDSDFPADQEPT